MFKQEKNKNSDKPKALEVIRDRVPDLIKELPRWICWRYEYSNNKWTKPPISPFNGKTANINDKNVWADFVEASAAHQSSNIRSDGIGFVLSKDDDIVGIDIDHCFKDGKITKAAQSIIKKFNSYTEFSPSGEGFRIFCKGHVPFAGRKNPKLGLEIYSCGRYLTVTGHLHDEQFTDIIENKAALDWLLDKHLSNTTNARVALNIASQRINQSQIREFLVKLCNSVHVNKFKSLFSGNIEQYLSPSEADMAFCGLLSNYTANSFLIDKMFRISKLMRPKWDDIHSVNGLTYGKITINNALSNFKIYKTKKNARYYLTNNERGDAELIQDLFQDRLIYNHFAKSWCIYDNGVWNLDEKQQARKQACIELCGFYNKSAKESDDKVSNIHYRLRFDEVSVKRGRNERTPEEKYRDECRKRVRNLNTRKYLSNVMELAKSYLAATTNEFDRYPLLINLRNGTFDLKNYEFREHRWKDFLSKQCNVTFNQNSQCPKWREFINKIFNGNQAQVEFIQQLVGYSFTGLTDLDVLLYCYGDGANGKSTFVKVIEELGSDYIVSIPIDVLLLKRSNNTDEYQRSRMKGARMVFTDEIPSGRTINESLVKSLTGGDTINARNPHEKPFSFESTHTMWCFGNHKLNIRGNDTGIWRRVHLIPFTYTFPEEERRERSEVIAEFKAELPGILNWVIEGFQSYKEKGLMVPDIVSSATQEYREETDTLGAFIDENCVLDKEHKCALKNFTKAYIKWCEENNEYAAAKTSKQIAGLLRSRGFDAKKGTGNRTYIWGLDLSANDWSEDIQLLS